MVYDTRADGPPLEFHGEPLITSDLVIIGSDLRQEGSVAFVYAFERESGRVRWKTPVQIGVMTDILAAGDRIYAATLEDRLLCLDPESGKIVWAFQTKSTADFSRRTSSPATDDRRVYFAGGDGTLHALDARTGEIVWKRDLGARPTTSVRMFGRRLYVGTAAPRLVRIDPESGKIDAELALAETPYSALTASGELLLFFHGERGIAAVDASLRGLRWKQPFGAPLSSARPYVWMDTILVGDEQGGLSGLRMTDGAAQWSETFPGIVRGIGSSGKTLYLGTLQGDIYAWDPDVGPPARPNLVIR